MSTTFLLLFTQSFITARNWLSWLLHGMDKVCQSKFEFENLSFFGKHDFDLWVKLLPKNVAHFLMHSHGCVPHVFGAPGHSHSRFLQFLMLFSPWLGSCFANSQWLGSLLGVFVVVFLITWLGKMFLGCTMSGRRDP